MKRKRRRGGLGTATARTSPAQIRIAERRAVVMDLRRQGHDFRTIANSRTKVVRLAGVPN